MTGTSDDNRPVKPARSFSRTLVWPLLAIGIINLTLMFSGVYGNVSALLAVLVAFVFGGGAFYWYRTVSSRYRLAPGDSADVGAAVFLPTAFALLTLVVCPLYGFSPHNLSRPQINGIARPGSILTATLGSWDIGPRKESAINYASSRFRTHWQRCRVNRDATLYSGCTDIPQATGTSYLPQQADVGSVVRAVVTVRPYIGAVRSGVAASPTLLVRAR
jgi:hypothetical protein